MDPQTALEKGSRSVTVDETLVCREENWSVFHLSTDAVPSSFIHDSTNFHQKVQTPQTQKIFLNRSNHLMLMRIVNETFLVTGELEIRHV